MDNGQTDMAISQVEPMGICSIYLMAGPHLSLFPPLFFRYHNNGSSVRSPHNWTSNTVLCFVPPTKQWIY